MQSSYNIIKNKDVITEGKKEISAINFKLIDKEKENIKENKETINIVNNDELLKSMENMADSIIKNAQIKSDKILVKASEDAKEIETNAFEKGSLEGYNNGFEKGYNDGMEKSLNEGALIIESANEVLANAKKEYKKYVEEKEEHFRKLVLTSVNEVLKKELSNAEALNNIVYDILSKEKNENYFIIRCNCKYKNSLEDEKLNMINRLAFNGDIFIVEDNSLEDGVAIIEKENGKVETGIDYIMSKLKELIMER
ncbi:FliH/SctL family protein [Clostridium senegalense]